MTKKMTNFLFEKIETSLFMTIANNMYEHLE